MINNFTKIKNKLIVSDMSDSKFRILCYLIARSKDGQCFPSIRTIANDLNKGKGTVSRVLDELVEEKILTKENRFLGTGKKTSNLYVINENYIVKKTKQEIFETTQEEIERKEPLFEYDWLNED